MALHDANEPRKKRGDSVLESERLSDAERDAFFAYVETHTLDDAVSYLLKRHNIELGRTAIGRWAERRRADAREEQFRAWLGTVKASEAEALTVAAEMAQTRGLADASAKALSVALFEAQRAGQTKSVAKLAKLVAMLLDGISRDKRAEAALADSRTARDKFELDATRLAMEALEDLLAIRNDAAATDEEKIQRARLRLWGDLAKPKEAAES